MCEPQHHNARLVAALHEATHVLKHFSGVCAVQVIMEGPEEVSAEAQARLVTCMQKPFVRDREALQGLMRAGFSKRELSAEDLAQWDSCFHCGMRLDLTVDSNIADNWYDAK